MPKAALDALDVVLGCFHSALRKKDDQTERYVRALQNPDIQIPALARVASTTFDSV